MAERKWGALTSGATFESLATTIIFFEDSKASLFGRRGKDGGQDARSGDGTRVFQAKHHENGSAAAAIRDAKSEAKKIEEYRKPGHSRHEQWKGVTHWRLVTNAAFNPTDKQTWDTEVVPLFTKQGLVADYWERENLNALLDKHPEIHRSFFENETRVFLSIPELKERLPHQEPFLRRDELGPFCGRTDEKAAIREFLASEKLFLVIHGAGGTGKTRLLVEAGGEIADDGEWQVLWANIESMAATSTWFEAIVPERATLLLVDEPSDETLLQQLAEQLGGRVGRTAKWKVAVAVRSPKDPVLRFLRGARMRPRLQELLLSALSSSDAEAMCFELLKTGKLALLPEDDRREAARKLGTGFARFPVWLTLAVQHLEDHGNLKQIPVNAETLADEYLLEIEKSQSEVAPESVRALLRWVALIGTVNREDDATVKLIGDGSRVGSVVDVRSRVASLVRRRALAERGAHNRFIELKPDVLRDHVLLRWLAKDVGGTHPEASDDAKALLEIVRSATLNGALSGLGRAILVSLARTEFLLRLSEHDLRLISGFFAALEVSVSMMRASQRVALADVLEAVAPFHPRAAASLVGVLRRGSAPDETVDGIFGEKVIGQADVLLSLAWPLFGGAMGAESATDREAVLRELCALAEAEAELALNLPRGLPNNGKRAASLVTRVLEGGPQFWSEYDDIASQLCTELIDTLMKQPPTPGQVALLKALVQPVLALERRQSWNDAQSVTWRTFAIGQGSPAWTAREAVFARVKSALSADATPAESRVQLWHVFAEAHRNINQLCARGKNDQYYPALLGDLTWTHELFAKRIAGVEELAAARKVWSWHHRFEKEPKLKAAADELEKLYTANDLAKEFEPLLSDDNWKAKDARVVAKGAELASASRPEAIAGFIDRAEAFLRAKDQLFSLQGVAWSLGTHAEAREVVRQFVAASLKQPTVNQRSEFGVVIAVSWVATVRASAPARAHVLVEELLAQCGSDERRANLLERIYGRVPKLRDVGDFTAEEHALLRGSRDLFVRTGRDVAFVAALALTVGHEWSALRPLLEDVLRTISPDRLPHAMYMLVDAIYWAVREGAALAPPSDLAEWLMSQLLALPDFDDLGGNGEWHLTEILKSLGGVDVRWLPGALAKRQEQEATNGDGHKARAVSHDARVSKYVRKIAAAEVTDPGVTEAVNKVLDFVDDNGTVGYYLPEILSDIDPDGVVVPAAVSVRAKSAAGAEDVRRLARIGGAYAVNSSPWRTIALAVIRAVTPHGAEALRSVYGSLDERGILSWSGAIGEVPPIFIAAVTEARTALDTEVEPDLRPYWQHRLTLAEADLREQEERAKEERGE
ncbi:MAG: ATP-binding protein [Myxococcaceae bacterium]|nr:ATP-binding protein [Myxococcaceae bacterium]